VNGIDGVRKGKQLVTVALNGPLIANDLRLMTAQRSTASASRT
jgi:hypothetical protein